MEDLGNKIIKQCGYLPLSIIVISGVLANKDGVDEWELVHRNIDLHLGKSKGEVSDVLDLSYNDLPYYLKPCFLYMANFPHYPRVSARKLLCVWIAEGFISYPNYKRDESLVDVAVSYLNELVDRGIIQARLKKRNGRVELCDLHDLIRDLCIRKAKEENFSHAIKLGNVNELTGGSSSEVASASPSCKIRRLSMDMKRYPQPREPVLESSPHLRALIFHGFYNEGENKQPFQTQALMNCRLLRVLDMDAEVGSKIIQPELIGYLVHLRYLRLCFFNLEVLPSPIGNLQFLETLDLQRMNIFDGFYVPNVLWKLKRLRDLRLPSVFSFRLKSAEKLKLDSLENLEYLKKFSLSMCHVKDLEKLVNLRKFTCFYKDDGAAEGYEIFPILSKINFKYLEYAGFEFWVTGGATFPESKLRQMSIYNRSCKLRLRGRIQKFPEFPPLLKKLMLTETQLEEDPMPVLEKPPNLISLELIDDCFIGKKMVCSSGGFPQMKSLKLWGLKLEELQVAGGSMPHLSLLEITACLKMVPECLSFTASRPKLEFHFRDLLMNYFQLVKEEQGWVFKAEN